MTEANDKALIKVALELRQLENAIDVAKMIQMINIRLNDLDSQIRSGYGATALKNRSPKSVIESKVFSDNCSDPIKKYIGFLKGWQDGFEDVKKFLETSENRRRELHQLIDIYTAGGDIVVAKLKGLEE
jgi:hypothetical protein